MTISVEWSAVNYKDGMVTRPGNRVARISPLVPGVDLVGTVLDSDDPSVGPADQVIVHGYDLGVAHHGGFSELARVPAEWVVPLPDGLDARRAGRHRHRRLHRRPVPPPARAPGALAPDDGPVLVTGASGGVGSMAVALLASRGYEVVASTGKAAERPLPDRPGRLRGHRPRRTGQPTPERTLGPERWAGAVDCVGGPTLAAVLRTLRYGAAVAASGLTGGNTFESSVYPFIVRDASLIGIDTVSPRSPSGAPSGTRWPRPSLPRSSMTWSARGRAWTSSGPALDRILAGGARGRMLVRPRST